MDTDPDERAGLKFDLSDSSYGSAELRIDDARLTDGNHRLTMQTGHYWRTGFNSDPT